MVFILFLIVPVLEVYLWIQFIDEFGFMMALLEVFMSAWIGLAILRYRGLMTLATVQKSMNDMNAKNIAKNTTGLLLVFLGGVFLILPGILSDVIGVLLIFPFTRAILGKLFVGRISHMASNSSSRGTKIFSVVTNNGKSVFTEEDLFRPNSSKSPANGTIIDIVPNEELEALESQELKDVNSNRKGFNNPENKDV